MLNEFTLKKKIIYLYIYIYISGSVAVGATTSILSGCTGIACAGVGITGTAGQCVCRAGYSGTAVYTNGAWGGCTICSGKFIYNIILIKKILFKYMLYFTIIKIGGSYNIIEGNNVICTNVVSCSSYTGYSGTPPNCVCTAGFSGTVAEGAINAALSGCYPCRGN